MASHPSLRSRIAFAPLPHDAAAAARSRDLFSDLDPEARDFLAGVAGCSPFLARHFARAPGTVRALLDRAPEDALAEACSAALRAADQGGDVASEMRALRIAKRDAALAVALAEISGAWSTLEAAAALSRFADAACVSALRMALGQLRGQGFAPIDPARPEQGSGLVILAMGKHGGEELNYSSDIDLIILFDSAAGPLGGPSESKRLAVNAAKLAVLRLSDQTADGYVFRTDLRLRPDPGVTPAALSVNAAEAYYESFGQNWERAAYIKARPAAGDLTLGAQFLERLRPFIWRRHLDFAAIEDVYAIVQQMRAAKGAAAIEFHGHDLKTGRGGIRDIEFLVQTQQLILGGKAPDVRARSTLGALAALGARGVFAPDAVADLSARYQRLRAIEHRLQMIADEQTHKIPAEADGAARLAAFLGEASVEAFARDLLGSLLATHGRFSAFFDQADRADAAAGDLDFSGVETDAATIARLAAMGFERPGDAAAAVRLWLSGGVRAFRTPRARALAPRFLPPLFAALSRADAPDEAFAAFDSFLRSLPAGVQIFSLFANRPEIFDRLIRIMTVSPFLGRALARRPRLVEALTGPDWPRPGGAERGETIRTRVAAAQGYEAALNEARRAAPEEIFLTAAELLTGVIDAGAAGRRFTAIAEATIVSLLPIAIAETRARSGPFEGALVVVALGRLGAGRMTAASDLDLVFVYEAPAGADAQEAADWCARFARRYLAALTAATEEGTLYEVDMKLRPSGAKGPAAASFSAFERYYAEEAWTFEKTALVKARVIAGDAGLGDKVSALLRRIVSAPRAPAATLADVAAMRDRLRAEKPPAGPFDVKRADGGATDVEFVTAGLSLISAAGGDPDPRRAIKLLQSSGLLSAEDAALLLTADETFETIFQTTRAAVGAGASAAGAGGALGGLIARALGAPSIDVAEAGLAEMQTMVRRLFDALIVQPSVSGASS